VLREHPISKSRAILKKLLNDSDEQVRIAAQQVSDKLQQLKETRLGKFAVRADLRETQK